jgi:hypothetical protein
MDLMIIPRYVYVLIDGETLEPYGVHEDPNVARALAVNGLTVVAYEVHADVRGPQYQVINNDYAYFEKKIES